MNGFDRLAPRSPVRAPMPAPLLPVMMNSSKLREVVLAGTGMYRPVHAPARPKALSPFRADRMGQLVTVNPNVQVNVQTGLEKYLFPVGLMAAGGASFIVGTVLPKDFKVVTTLAGLGLIGWGVYVLIKGGTSSGAAAQPGAPAATPPPPTGATPVEASPQPFLPPTAPAFNQLQVEMVTPDSGANISSVGTFLGIGKRKIPVQLRFYNPTQESVTFNLTFEWDEFGSAFGINLDPKHGTADFQVTVGPGEQKNQDFTVPIVTTGSSGPMSVAMQIYKNRVPSENRYLVVNRSFTVN